MEGAPGPTVCRVCKQRAAAYTCPRCNARYCSVDCYKAHSDHCTEGFYRDSTVRELRGITATQDEKQRMQEILQRLHEQELGADSDSDTHSEGGSGDEAAAHEGGLSEETMHRLLARLQASGGELEVSEADLSPAELAAFHRAVAAGELAGVVAPWQPWWLSEEAATLELGAGGTRLVSTADGGAEAAGAGSMSLPPPPPSKPLPPLSSLTQAQPSPMLQYQLLDLLYAYCLTLRLYNGDYQSAAVEAADTLLAVSCVLAATAAGSSEHAAGAAACELTPASVLLDCVSRACQPPAGSREQRGFAVGALADVGAVLRRGRTLVILALMDLTRLIEAARQQQQERLAQAAGGASAGHVARPGGTVRQAQDKQRKALARRLVAAQRKLLFFLSWANEQSQECYAVLRLAVAKEHDELSATLGAKAAGPPGSTPAAERVAAQLQAPQRTARPQAAIPAIQEV